jgi:L-amino acid N-acyltransferase YncA
MIRDAVEADLGELVRIYNAAIPGRLATADTEPISVESRRAWLLERDTRRHPLWVFEEAGRIAGWFSFGKFYGRPAYAATAEISFYIDPAAQRRGIATALTRHAIERAPALGLTTLLGFVFAHNQPSLALLQRFGFETWGDLPRIAVLDGTERGLLILGKRVDNPQVL